MFIKMNTNKKINTSNNIFPFLKTRIEKIKLNIVNPKIINRLTLLFLFSKISALSR